MSCRDKSDCKMCKISKTFFEPRAIFYRPPNAIEQKSAHVRCLEYEFNENETKIYQTFDLPFIFKMGKYEFIKDAEEAIPNYYMKHTMLSQCMKNATLTCIAAHTVRESFDTFFSLLRQYN